MAIVQYDSKCYYYMMQCQLAASAELQINSLFPVLLSGRFACSRQSISIMRLAVFQNIIYLVTATANNPITFLACAFIFYIAKITQK